MTKFKRIAASIMAATALATGAFGSMSAYAAEESEFEPSIDESLALNDISVTGSATKGVGSVWYVDKDGNIFTQTWSEYWSYDGSAGLGWISYNKYSDTDRIKVHHNTHTHNGYVQNRNSMTGQWTNYADPTEWTNIALIGHGSGTIRFWFYN